MACKKSLTVSVAFGVGYGTSRPREQIQRRQKREISLLRTRIGMASCFVDLVVFFVGGLLSVRFADILGHNGE